MRTETFKHLEDPFRVGGLAIWHWLMLAGCGALAIVFGFYVSPFGAKTTIVISILAAGLPFAASYGVQGSDSSALVFLRSVGRWVVGVKHCVPGASETPGYVVQRPAVEVRESREVGAVCVFEAEEMFNS